MEEITIRPYKEGDELSINEAFNKMFGLRRSMEEWYWKFDPEGKASRIMVAVDNQGEILVNYSAVTILMQIDGRQLLCAQSLDSYSLKRDKLLKNRVFIKTYNKFCEEFGGGGKIPYFYGCIGGRPLKLGTRTMKYTDPVTILYLCSRETNILLRPYGMLFGKFVWNRYHSRWNNLDLDAVDDLWKRSSHRYPVSTVRDGRYIKRRYLRNPVKNYVCIPAYRNGLMNGLAIFSYINRRLEWIDLIWDGKYWDTVSVLKKYAWDLTLGTGSVKFEMWLLNDDDAKRILIYHGMKTAQNPYDLYVSSRSFDERLDAHDITNRLYFTMGDSDMF